MSDVGDVIARRDQFVELREQQLTALIAEHENEKKKEVRKDMENKALEKKGEGWFGVLHDMYKASDIDQVPV